MWSWGVLCVELLTQQKPYASLYATPVQIALQVSQALSDRREGHSARMGRRQKLGMPPVACPLPNDPVTQSPC